MIVMQQNDSFCKEEKINFFNLHQSNLAINSQNRNLEPDLEMHKGPISTTTPKSKLTPELSNDLRHARLLEDYCWRRITPHYIRFKNLVQYPTDPQQYNGPMKV